MSNWLITTLCSAGTLVTTLIVTFIFNKVVGLPKVLKQERLKQEQQAQQLKLDNAARDSKIAALEAALRACPSYRAQNSQIQEQLQITDTNILKVCQEIQLSVESHQQTISRRLDRLERREKNSIRAKLLEEYRLFTDNIKNPLLAWSEMEHHAFFELVGDYEELNGNDYIHTVVLPAVNELTVIYMSDKVGLSNLMQSRKF